MMVVKGEDGCATREGGEWELFREEGKSASEAPKLEKEQ